jgi:hypothetical protein
MSKTLTKITDDIVPKAVMTEAELAAWDVLPPAEKRVRLRAAIEKGMASGVSSRSMDDILDAALAKSANARL